MLRLYRTLAIATLTFLTGVSGVASAQEVIVYYHTDAIGSVRMITDESGSVIANYHFLPFGEAFPVDPQAPADKRMFTGAERDPETNFDYLGARYYQSQTGRFTRPDDPGFADPFNPQSMNLYAYAYNNPLKYVDPTGHSGDCVYGYDSSTGLCTGGGLGEEFRFFFERFTERFGPAVQTTTDTLVRFFSTPPDPGCVAKWSGAGASIGLGVGSLGFAGGPAAALTVPGSVGAGGLAGTAIGVGACMNSANRGGGGNGGPTAGRSRAGNMQKQVERGQAPKSVDRVDRARSPFERDQVHFKDGHALNHDGTWKHGGRPLTRAEMDWLMRNGWSLP